MPLTRPNFEEVSETDLVELVTAGSSESLYLDFKRQSYGGNDAEKRELLKDVSAFANSQGGHIVIGMEEVRGSASALPGITVADADAEVLRLGQIVRGGLEPDVHGIGLRAVQLSTGNHAIVIRVPKSWRAPHRVSAQGSNRYWLRNSSGCHEASVDELRVMYQQSATALEGARRFRDERISLIRRADGPRPLVGEGRFFFHIVPQSALLTADSIDVHSIYQQHGAFMPLGSSGMSPRFNLEGVIYERGGDVNHGYTQIFRNGSVEATKGRLLRTTDSGLGLAGLALEQHFFEALERYINGLKALGVQPPLILMLTLEGVRGARYFVASREFFDELQPIDRDLLVLPDCLVTEYGSRQSYHSAIRPALDALWNAVGHPRCLFYSADGLWEGRLH